MIVAGNETTTKLLGNAVYWLSRNPEQREKVRRDPALIPLWVEETLRYDNSTQALARLVARDVELHGEKLRAGDKVVLLVGSANRDERAFPDPDRFDVHRNTQRSLAFGQGTALLSRRVARAARGARRARRGGAAAPGLGGRAVGQRARPLRQRARLRRASDPVRRMSARAAHGDRDGRLVRDRRGHRARARARRAIRVALGARRVERLREVAAQRRGRGRPRLRRISSTSRSPTRSTRSTPPPSPRSGRSSCS